MKDCVVRTVWRTYPISMSSVTHERERKDDMRGIFVVTSTTLYAHGPFSLGPTPLPRSPSTEITSRYVICLARGAETRGGDVRI